MEKLLILISVKLLLVVSGTTSATFPGAARVNRDFGDANKIGYNKASNEGSSLDGDYQHETEEARNERDYVTDVQISEVERAQQQVVQDQEAYVLDPRCPTFTGNCTALTCSFDDECGGQICCYNGCVHSCADDKFFQADWIRFGELGAIANSILSSAGDTSSDTIVIPGGCKMSHRQSDSLDLFLEFRHITKCVCARRDVLCHVRKRESNS